MNRFVSIPRDALAELLRVSGSTLTPEEYVASFQQDAAQLKKYRSRAWSAAISKYCILAVAVFGVILFPFLGDYIENGIIVAGLITVTYFEFRVHRYFQEGDPRAPGLGFRNQAGFAAGIIIYCLYSAFMPHQLSHDDMTMLEQNNLIDPGALNGLVRTFYLFIALVAGGSQFGLACYYRSAGAVGK